jgi:integrase
VARVRYLTVAQAERLLNACCADFHQLVRAALETGCRYNELARMEVQDFNPDANTVTIRKSKSGKPRHVMLTPEGLISFASTAPVAKAQKRCFAAPMVPPGKSQTSLGRCARPTPMPGLRRQSPSMHCATPGRA